MLMPGQFYIPPTNANLFWKRLMTLDPLRTTYHQGDADPAGALNRTNARVNLVVQSALIDGLVPGSIAWLNAVVLGELFTIVSATYDGKGALATASILWPNSVPGVLTTLVASTTFPGAIDSFAVTYASTPPQTITQPAVTRDAGGRVTAQPELVIS